MLSRKLVVRTAAVASFAGMAIAFSSGAAFAQDAGTVTDPSAEQGTLNLGSLFNVLDTDKLSGSLTGSLMDSDPSTGSTSSVGAVLNEGSLTLGLKNAQGSTTGSAGSVGDAAGIFKPDTFGPTVAGSIESASSGPSSTETLDRDTVSGSIANFLGAVQDANA